MIFNSEEIKAILPHRYPMLLVDRVTSLKEDGFCEGYKNISVLDPFFEGHFPQRAVMPGVLMLEASAQLAGVLIAKSFKKDATNKLVYLAGVDKMRLRRQLIPGDQMHMRVEKLHERMAIWRLSAVIRVDGELAMECVITCAISSV